MLLIKQKKQRNRFYDLPHHLNQHVFEFCIDKRLNMKFLNKSMIAFINFKNLPKITVIH